MITEIVGGVELSVYGLRLAKLDGNLSLPPYKNILDESDLESNLRVLDEKNIEIRLIGFYASKSALGTAINNFKNKIRSAVKLVWVFTNHDINASCVVKNGMKIIPYQTSVEIYLTLTITE